MWPNNRILELFGIQLPIIQAPMAGSVFYEMVVAVSEAGGLGSLPCALLSLEQMRNELEAIRRQTSRPINMNFFCHTPPRVDANRERLWRQRLQRYYVELGLDENMPVPSANRAPFDEKMCDLVIEFHPEVVSFHFGLPEEKLVQKVRDTGAKVVSSATSVDEARWLEDRGCDAIVAQGSEAGGPEAKISPVYREALKNAADNQTTLTNIFTGRPARAIVNRAVRELGPMSDNVPDFPLAAASLGPLRSHSEATGSADFTPLWSGQAARLARELPAAALTKRLSAETLERLRTL